MKFYRLLFYSLILSLAIPAGAPAVQPEPARAAVIISRQIRPYIEVSEGVLSVLGDMADVSAEVFFLDRMKASGRDLLPEQFIDGTFTLFLAIGPEAAQYLWHRLPSTPGVKIYSVVLNPGKNIPALDANQCGIPLNIPVAQQVENIHQALPGIRRIGMIYDPAYNERFYQSAAARADSLEIIIKPLRVDDKKNIPDTLQSHLASIDCLWMIPDATVISETIIQYIIKSCLLQKKFVIGYNKFFYESGAGLSFVFDYYRIGRQAGSLVASAARGAPCGRQIPEFEIWLNRRVFDRLGIKLPENPVPPVRIKR